MGFSPFHRFTAKTARCLVIAILFFGASNTAPSFAQDFDKGYEAALAEDFDTALKELRPLAEAGHAAAQYVLGFIYKNGKTVAADPVEAARWYRRAAEQGHMEAQYTLGFLYSRGDGVPEDWIEAASWFQHAAKQGHITAQFSLGYIYRFGQNGVPKDGTEAVKWYRLAAEQGHVSSQESMGYSYFFGHGVPQDLAKAARWYRRAAEQGSASAQYSLGDIYQRGKGVATDAAKAAHWFTLAAKQNHAEAQFDLGFMLYHGRGIAQQPAEATKWFHAAAEQGHALAQSKLGAMYEFGVAVPQDPAEASKWYDRAAAQGVTEIPERDLLRLTAKLESAERKHGMASPQVLHTLHALGHVYRAKLSFRDKARETYRRGYGISRKLNGASDAKTLEFLGLYVLELNDGGQVETALPLARELVKLSRTTLGPAHVRTLYRTGTLSVLLAKSDKREEANQLLLDGMAVAAAAHGEDHALVTSSLGTQVAVIDTNGANPRLVDTLRNVLNRTRQDNGETSPKTRYLMTSLSEALIAVNEPLPAMEVLGDLISAHEERLLLASALDDITRKSVIAESRQAGIRFAQQAWSAQATKQAPGSSLNYKGRRQTRADLNETLAKEAFHAAQMGQSGAAYALGRAMARLALDDAGLQATFAAYEAAQEKALAITETLGQQIQDQGGQVPDATAQIVALQNDRTAAIEQVRTLEEQLEAEFPRFFEFLAPRPVTAGEVRGTAEKPPLLGPNEALLQIMPPKGGTPGLIWAISQDGFAWSQIPGTEAELREDLMYLHSLLDGGGATQTRGDDADSRGGVSLAKEAPEDAIRGFDRAFAHDLFRTLFGDPAIQKIIKSKPEWILAPQGMFLSLPFSTLVTTAPPGGRDGDADPAQLRRTSWLGTTHALSVVPAVSSLRMLRRAAKDGAPERGNAFFGLGDPDFSGSASADRSAALVDTQRFFRSAVADPAMVKQLSRLPGTRREIEQLAAVFKSPGDAILLGKDASETGLAKAQRSGVLQGSRVIMLATHGLMAGAFDGLDEPALAMTPPVCGVRPLNPDNETETGGKCPAPLPDPELDAAVSQGAWIEDGLLTASDVTHLKLNADWVILSACDTAAGSDQSPDAEGLSGLARSFFFAGARSLLVSHWPVRDDVAALLTPEAVSQAATGSISRAEALRQAMEQLVSNTGSDAAGMSFAHPAAWAPFQVTGVDARGR
ncbi:CHAT domain-containing protein [Roseovarius sp. MMSF_3281]|uniref:CHAT domain-containing protein n=1 Tax=Roseovarius sp. MMSF_3281 TaxID=3046694 RepID=UPI00273D7842|nr:CHAT domain-containing protein [Roseovarius sp. MMSF_3281]